MNINIKKFDELSTSELYNILKLRAQVFVVEQNCIYNDMDDADFLSLHVFYANEGDVLAYLRIIPMEDNIVKIGRVAAKEKRTGIGTNLLKEGISAARNVLGAKKIIVHAQSYIKSFYAKQGFVQTSDEFMEENIPHVKMELSF